MCLCWNYNENGEITGICSIEEISHRIHDPNYMPELKKLRRNFIKKKDKVVFTDDKKEKLRQDWLKTIKKG